MQWTLAIYLSIDPNSTTLPMLSTPGIDSPVIGLQSICSEFISPVFGMHVPPTGWDLTTTHTQPNPYTLL